VATILVIEDDSDISRLLGVRLRNAGYDLAFATDGMTAMSVARQTQPDAILLDLGLPAGDGYLVMERLRSFPALAHVPVIVVSSRDPLTNEERSLTAGARAFLQKPIDVDRLLAEIRNALGEG